MKKYLLLLSMVCMGRLYAQTIQVLDNCENNTGWRGSQAVTLDSLDVKQGSYCLKSDGAGTDRFNKAFPTPVNTGITNVTEGFLVFWLYVSDITKLSASSGQIEITSAGRPDVSEYNWPVKSQNLQNGWNEIVLKMTAAGSTNGTPDLSAINFFRLYQPVTGAVVFKIDHIRFSNGNLPTPIAGAHILNACDDTGNWSGSDSITTDAVNRILGQASLKKTGKGTDWFVYNNSGSPFDTKVSREKGIMKCWLFVSNSQLLKDSGMVSVSSSGNATQNALHWSLSSQKLQTGWNHIFLRLSEAQVSGVPNLSQINYFKLSHPVNGTVTARLDEIEFFEPKPVDASSLNAKVMFGYQGWFSTPNDGQGVNWWKHWFGQSPAVYSNSSFDIWPDMRDYPDNELDATQMQFSDGSPAKLFSHYHYNTVDRHFRWLQENELDGVFQQRFLSTVRNATLVQTFKKVIENVKAASEKYQRVYCIMYDLSGADANTVADVQRDWMQLVDDMQLTNGPTYLKHKGRPLVALWGLGIAKNPAATPQQADSLITWFSSGAPEKYRATVMGGLNDSWLSHDAAWQAVYNKLDVISPWTVGRYGNESGANNFANTKVRPEVQYCNNLGIDYMPVIWPGFSWYNLQTYRNNPDGAIKNQVPRNGGSFYWQQSYNVLSAGAGMVYIAMLDEVDEGTSMFKMAKSAADIPANSWYLTLDADGFDLTPDWYMSLASYTKKVFDQKTSNSTFIPLRPNALEPAPLAQTILFDSIPAIGVVSDGVALSGSASSGLPVQYVIADSSIAVIIDGKIIPVSVGQTVVTAMQPGNEQYEEAAAVSYTLIVYDNQPPTAPSALTAFKTNGGKIQLVWQPSSDNVGVTGYTVFRDGVQVNSPPATGTSFITNKPTGNIVQSYTVKAVDADGNVSNASNVELVSNSNGNGNMSMDELMLMPNPNNGHCKLRLRCSETGSVTITVSNAAGVVVQQVIDSKNSEWYQKDIRLGEVLSGYYLVKVMVGGFSRVKMLVVR